MRSSESAPNHKELPVSLPTLYREVRFRIREAALERIARFGISSLGRSRSMTLVSVFRELNNR
jgi:hypothetical protein